MGVLSIAHFDIIHCYAEYAELLKTIASNILDITAINLLGHDIQHACQSTTSATTAVRTTTTTTTGILLLLHDSNIYLLL